MDAKGRLGGMAIRLNSRSVKVKKSWGFESGLGVEVVMADLGVTLLILNIYGPYKGHHSF